MKTEDEHEYHPSCCCNHCRQITSESEDDEEALKTLDEREENQSHRWRDAIKKGAKKL